MTLTPEGRTGRRRKFAGTGLIGREQGATAILIALLALFVLLPLAGLATSSFIRAGTVAELSLAADAGALAGAAAIPVGDIEFLAAYIDLAGDKVPDNEEVDALMAKFRPSGAPTPLEIARTQCLAALASNGQIGSAFDSGDPITCEPEYISDLDFVNAFGTCFTAVKDSQAWPYLVTLRNALPGLLNPGVRVRATRGVDPPLESLVGNADSRHTADSYARRRFKNAVVLPIIVVPPISVDIPGVTSTVIDLDDIPLNPLVELTQQQVLDALRTVDGAIDDYNDTTVPPLSTPLPDFPPECRGMLPALADDMQDLVNPPEQGGPTSEDMLDEADATGGEVQILRLFGFTPFFDFVRVCVRKIDADSFEQVDCAANAPGAFRATLVRG